MTAEFLASADKFRPHIDGTLGLAEIKTCVSATALLADIGALCHQNSMFRNLINFTILILGCLLLGPAVFFNMIAWGQWKCGLNPFQLSLSYFLAALGASLAMIGLRRLMSPTKISGAKAFVFPWLTALMLSMWVTFLAPECPFPSY